MQLATWDQIRSLFQGIEQRLSEELRKSSDLGISEFRTLHHLLGRPEREIRMQELAEILQLSQSSTTRLVERLERKGFVTRDTCPSDGRGVYCVLGEQGEAFITKAAPGFERVLNRVLAEALSAPGAAEIARAFHEQAETEAV